MRREIFVGAFAIAVVTACGSKRTQLADEDAGVEAGPGPCTGNTQCGGSTPICTAAGTCVQCEMNGDCPAGAPFCVNNVCGSNCAGKSVGASLVKLPSDIIWVVDQSGSMDQETAYVQAQINGFATQIQMSGIDYHVIMIADPTGSNAICVPPPLAGPMCGDSMRFKLVPQHVGSNDGPQLAISTYAQYSNFLRKNATKHFVFITDDDSSMNAAQFTQGVLALPPAGMFQGFKVHAVYAYGLIGIGCVGPFGTGAAEGKVYTDLVTQTGGAQGVICTGNWTQVLQEITKAVVSGALVACELDLPPPPMGSTLDPNKVNVAYLAGGMTPGTTLPHVKTAGDCTPKGGWYYDNNAAPTKVIFCPATCTTVQKDTKAKVNIEFGCQTVVN